MIQHQKFSSNIKEFKNNIPYRDTTLSSDNYFRLFDIPQKLFLGKNSFRIRINKDYIAPNSLIYIDILDSNNKPIYHDISSYLGEDGSRLVIVNIYENTPPGESTIMIAGRMTYNINTKKNIPYTNDEASFDFKDFPNLLWEKKLLVVPSVQNLEEIIYINPPTIKYLERTEPYNKIINLNQRKTNIYGTGSIKLSLKSIIDKYQYSNSTRFNTTYTSTRNTIDIDPVDQGNYLVSQQTQIPKYSPLTTIVSEGFEFTPDMVGGNIIITNINDSLLIPSSSISLDIPNFSANIISILDKHTATIDRNFLTNISDVGYTTIRPTSNFTCSYYTSDAPIETTYSESFLELKFSDLEPIAGVVDSIKLSYKNFGSFGDFIPIGNFNLIEQNILVDTSSIIPSKIGIVEKPIGNLVNYTEYLDYWDININPSLDLYYGFAPPTLFETGFSLYYTSSVTLSESPDYFIYTYIKEPFRPVVNKNTEYKLEFSAKLNSTASASHILDIECNQIDVYISGTFVNTDLVHQTNIIPPLRNYSFGTYIGSVTTDKSKTILNSKMYFKTDSESTITPIFVIRSGQFWELKDICIYPRNEFGYSPNVAKINVPLNMFKTNTELILLAEYMNSSGRKASQDTKLIGVNFSGSSIHEILTDTNIISGSQQIRETLDTSSLNSITFSNAHINSLPPAGEVKIFNQTGSLYMINDAGVVNEISLRINESHFAPTTGDIAIGRCSIWKNTTTNNIYLYVNDDGTLKKIELT